MSLNWVKDVCVLNICPGCIPAVPCDTTGYKAGKIMIEWMDGFPSLSKTQSGSAVSLEPLHLLLILETQCVM